MTKFVFILLALAACSDDYNTYNIKSDGAEMPDHDTRAKKQGWQQSGTLTTGDTTKQVSMQADFPVAGYYTVQFGVKPPELPPPTAQPAFDIEAEITWSVEGQFVRRLVSVGNGTSVSGPGQAVKVTIRDKTAETFPLTAALDYTVSVQVTPGTRPAEERPPILRGFPEVVDVAPLGVTSIDVPPDAGVISVETTAGIFTFPPATAQANVQVVQSTAGVVLKAYMLGDVKGFVPLAPNARLVSIRNNSAVDTYRIQFTWGIDG